MSDSETPQNGEVQYFELPDGRKINVYTGRPVHNIPETMVEVPKHSEAQALVAQTRRKLIDLPDIPEKMNVISAVVSYTLFGLDEDEIALALRVSVERVRAIKMLDAFSDMYESVIEGIKSRDLDPINKMIEDQAPAAVRKITELMREADSDKVSLNAAQDILDRSGRRPVDVHEHRVMHEGGLVIEHIERSEHADVEQLNDALDAEFVELSDSPTNEDNEDGDSS